MRTSASSVIRWLSRGGAPGAARNARRAVERHVREQWTVASLEERLGDNPLTAEQRKQRAR